MWISMRELFEPMPLEPNSVDSVKNRTQPIVNIRSRREERMNQ